MAWLPGFLHRVPIIADTSALLATETDIPLALFWPNLTGKRLQASWYDVVPTLADGVTVPDFCREIASDTGGVGHVEWPTLTYGQAALALGYLYYGNAAATDLSNEVGTFGNGFVARYGCSDAGPTTVADSLGVNNGTQSGGVTFGAAGKIGNCLSFDGGNDYVALEHCYAGFGLTTGITVSCWVNPNDVSGYHMITEDGFNYSNDCMYMGILPQASQAFARIGLSNLTASYDDHIALGLDPRGVWTHMALRWSSGSAIILTANGTTVWTGATLTGSLFNATDLSPVLIGTRSGALRWAGYLDDFRIASVARSATFVNAEWRAGMGTLLSYGAEETLGGLTLPKRYGVRGLQSGGGLTRYGMRGVR